VHVDDYVQSADLYECPNCHTQILTGFGQPILAIGEDRLYVERFSQLGQKACPEHSRRDGVFFKFKWGYSNSRGCKSNGVDRRQAKEMNNTR